MFVKVLNFILKSHKIDMSEKRILLSEPMFTFLCKRGSWIDQVNGKNVELSLSSREIATLCKGEILDKVYVDWSGDLIFKFALQDIGFDTINEILKRSPLFADLAGNFLNM